MQQSSAAATTPAEEIAATVTAVAIPIVANGEPDSMVRLNRWTAWTWSILWVATIVAHTVLCSRTMQAREELTRRFERDSYTGADRPDPDESSCSSVHAAGYQALRDEVSA